MLSSGSDDSPENSPTRTTLAGEEQKRENKASSDHTGDGEAAAQDKGKKATPTRRKTPSSQEDAFDKDEGPTMESKQDKPPKRSDFQMPPSRVAWTEPTSSFGSCRAPFVRASPSPAMAPAVVSGERLVVFLFVARVALAAPAQLAAPLGLLTAAALAVELAVDGSASASASSSPLCRFRTRPGASSGILLGATTLPSVMLSQLIQLSRVLLADPNGSEEYAYLEMQYWAVSISCLSVLAFFVWHLRQSPNNGISKASKYGSLLIILYPLAYLFYFVLKTDGGLLVMSNLVYLLCHGVADVILIQHILQKFPSCSSFGEAILVSSGLVLYCGDILAHTLSKMEFFVSSEAFIHAPGTRSEIGIVIQGVLLGLFLLPLLYKSSLQVLAHYGEAKNTNSWGMHKEEN